MFILEKQNEIFEEDNVLWTTSPKREKLEIRVSWENENISTFKLFGHEFKNGEEIEIPNIFEWDSFNVLKDGNKRSEVDWLLIKQAHDEHSGKWGVHGAFYTAYEAPATKILNYNNRAFVDTCSVKDVGTGSMLLKPYSEGHVAVKTNKGVTVSWKGFGVDENIVFVKDFVTFLCT
jgi:hypothetical protein